MYRTTSKITPAVHIKSFFCCLLGTKLTQKKGSILIRTTWKRLGHTVKLDCTKQEGLCSKGTKFEILEHSKQQITHLIDIQSNHLWRVDATVE